ncbi:MAG: hypothetical protein WC297_03785 [Candidatus Paceibacterota bacterium]|jgi:hypothetical protein
MITTAILYLLYGVVKAIISPITLLPDVSLSSNVSNAIASASNYLEAVDFILPVATIIAVFAIILVVEGAILAYKMINWLIRKIPGIN